MAVPNIATASSTSLTFTNEDATTKTATVAAAPTLSDDAQGIIFAIRELTAQIINLTNKIR